MAQNLSAEQIAEYRDVFSVYDQDGNGKISTAELGSIIRKFTPGISEANIEAMIRAVDSDRSGTIEFSEFLALMTSGNGKTDNDSELREAFKVFDKDGNGVISRTELRNALSDLGSTLNDEEIDAMIKEADVNGDGQINYEEFVLIMTSK